MAQKLIVSSPPYLRNGETAHCLMFDAGIAALPALACSVYFFGLHALIVVLLSITTAVVTEVAVQIFFTARDFRFRPFLYNLLISDDITITDGSALITGLLLAFCLPPGVPFWIPVVGSAVAIVIGKHVFGGIGYNVFNPALVGRAFLLAAWPACMTTWKAPVSWWSRSAAAADAVTAATPLAALKLQGQTTPLLDLLTGNTGGCLGETSAVAIMAGAAYLLYKRTITWHIPLSYIGTVLLLTLALGQDPVFHLFAGGLMLGAFFMATDVVTSPVTATGRLLFGCGAGAITVLIRMYGGYPEGVCYAILIMNALTPLIERATTRRGRAAAIDIPLLDKTLKNG